MPLVCLFEHDCACLKTRTVTDSQTSRGRVAGRWRTIVHSVLQVHVLALSQSSSSGISSSDAKRAIYPFYVQGQGMVGPRYNFQLPISSNKLVRATRLLCWDFDICEQADAPIQPSATDEQDLYRLGLEQCRILLGLEVLAMEETSGATKGDVHKRLARLLVTGEYLHNTSYKSLECFTVALHKVKTYEGQLSRPNIGSLSYLHSSNRILHSAARHWGILHFGYFSTTARFQQLQHTIIFIKHS